jgi:hypothetical protein
MKNRFQNLTFIYQLAALQRVGSLTERELRGAVGEEPHLVELALDLVQRRLVVALQVTFERQTLKPGFHLIGYRLWV